MVTHRQIHQLVRTWLLGASLSTGITAVTAQGRADLDKISSSPIPDPAARSAEAAGQERTGNLIYTPPAGWKREAAGEVVAYIAPGLGAGENFRIIVAPGEEITGDFQTAFEKQMGAIRTSLKAQLIGAGKFNELKGPQGSDALGRTDIVELPGGVRWTCFLCLLHTGTRAEPIVAFGSSGELYAKYVPELNRFISRVRFARAAGDSARHEAAKTRILAQGDPPLTQEMVDRYNLFFEWLLDAPMTQEQRQRIQDAVVADWKAGRSTEIQTAVKIVQAQEQIEQKTESERDLLRASMQPKVLDPLRKQPDNESARWVLALYDNAHKPIATGTVPLTRQMADSFIEMLCFMHNQAVSGEPFIATHEDKDQFAKTLAGLFGKYNPELQKHIASMPALWAALRYQWSRLNDTDRSAWKSRFQAYMKNMAPEYLRETHPPQAQQARQGSSGNALADAGRSMRQHNNYVFLSNMMTMRHVATMNVISNFGNSGYHYTYH